MVSSMKVNWQISHRPYFEIPGRKEFPSLRDHVDLVVAGFLLFWVLHDCARAHGIAAQWGWVPLYLMRDAWHAIIHPGG